jgi:hypothetical protein
MVIGWSPTLLRHQLLFDRQGESDMIIPKGTPVDLGQAHDRAMLAA